MAPVTPDEAARVARLIEDAVLSSEKVRDGLRDDEAIPFIEWGLERARHLAARLAGSATSPLDEEQIADKGYALTRLMTRVNWLVTYRHKKDAAWLTRTFQMINQLSRELYGENAPTFSDEEIAAWLGEHAQRSDAELLASLLARLTPAPSPPTETPPAAPPLPGRPAFASGPSAAMPPSPGSQPPSASPAPSLPGRSSSVSPAPSEDQPPFPGDEHGSPEQ